jgi:DNA-binding XRE family transcriptional regulator
MAHQKSNPFRELRLRQGISQYELARRIGCSKHAILRLEQGMYYEPLPTVIDYFVNHSPKDNGSVTRYSLTQDYHDFQIHMREANSRLLGDLINELTACPVGKHPLTYLLARVPRN